MKKLPLKNKVIVIKKENIISVLVCMLLLAAAAGAVVRKTSERLARETFALPTSDKIIVIDPGHGGIDAGASDGELKEKEINLDIALRLQGLIEQSGGTVFLTRSEDVSTADKNRDKGITQKKSDLTERKKLIEKYNADMFISIHMNKFPVEKYSGAQVFYNKKSEEGKALAECVQSAMKNYLDKNNRRSAKGDDSIYVLKNNNVPSILIECGFLSNNRESAKLKTDEYRQKIAWAIFMGLTDYAKNK